MENQWKTWISFSATVFLFLNAACQVKNIAKSDKCLIEKDSILHVNVYTSVDTLPSFGNDQLEVIKYFRENFNEKVIDDYQRSFRFVLFIDEKGKVIQCRVIGKPADKYSNGEKEGIRVFENMPLWKPGICGKRQVVTRLLFPIKF
jgi:hypothetical protein